MIWYYYIMALHLALRAFPVWYFGDMFRRILGNP